MPETTLIKPMLAVDIQEDKLKFPLYVSPKIDGVFMLVQNAKAYARSLKPHENKYITALYSNPDFEGLRGELIAGDNPRAEGLCRNTSSASSRIEGQPETTWCCFDYVTTETVNLPYSERYLLMLDKVTRLQHKYSFIKYVAANQVDNFDNYLYFKNMYLEQGFEGLIARDPTLVHKEGRSSKVKAYVWRFKPYLDAEILVTGITEGNSNQNTAEVNELGNTRRSSAKGGLVPNGTVGSLQGTLLADLVDFAGKVIQVKGTVVTISPGEMTAAERKYYFENPAEIIGKIAKFKYMAFGLKDTARFPTFVTLRSATDMS